MPALHKRVTKETFSHLSEKVDRKLVGWKSKFLSLAGRVTLAKSTLSTMALYSMQTAKIPRATCDAIDRKTRNFIWGDEEDKRKVHLISWETLQKPKTCGGLGFASMRQANSAFLAKLGWRLLTHLEALWSRVVRSKYCKGRCDIDMFQSSSNCSNLWKGITENAKYIKQGAQTAVGDGKTTLFWDHKWVMNQPLSDLCIKEIPETLLGCTVEEMWDFNLGWKWDKFAELLPLSVLKRIQAHELSVQDNVGDSFFWSGSSHGEFSIKSAISIIRDDNSISEDPKWQSVWTMVAQNRVKFFMWLAIHDRILCNENRRKRKLTDDNKCPVCLHSIEDLLHTLRDCYPVRNLWHSLCPRSKHQNFFLNINLQDWLLQNIVPSNLKMSDDWAITFPLTCWWVWKWRNQHTFRGGEDIPFDRISFIEGKVEETKYALTDKKEASITSIRRQECFIRWQPPLYEWAALNTDGAAKGCPGETGGGGIIRNHLGHCVGCFTANFGVCTASKAELLALKHGLELAWSKDIKLLDVRLDNKACVQALNNETNNLGANMAIVRHCKRLIARQEWTVVITHVYREANQASDWLANVGVKQQLKLQYLDSIPPDLARIVREDLQGVARPRFINV